MTESKPPVSARVLRTNRSAASIAAAPPSVPVPPAPPPEPPRYPPPEPADRNGRPADAGRTSPPRAGTWSSASCAARGIADERVLAAMGEVPRSASAPDDRTQAYDDTPLAIGYGQTISQPDIVALHARAARPAARERLLEVGAGSGYAAAVASHLVRQVVATERIGGLAARAARALARRRRDQRAGARRRRPAGVPAPARSTRSSSPPPAERFPERRLPRARRRAGSSCPWATTGGQRLELVRRGPQGPEVTHWCAVPLRPAARGCFLTARAARPLLASPPHGAGRRSPRRAPQTLNPTPAPKRPPPGPRPVSRERVARGLRKPANWLQLIKFGLVGLSGLRRQLRRLRVRPARAGPALHARPRVAFCRGGREQLHAGTATGRSGRGGTPATRRSRRARFFTVAVSALDPEPASCSASSWSSRARQDPGAGARGLLVTPISFLGNKLWSFR